MSKFIELEKGTLVRNGKEYTYVMEVDDSLASLMMVISVNFGRNIFLLILKISEEIGIETIGNQHKIATKDWINVIGNPTSITQNMWLNNLDAGIFFVVTTVFDEVNNLVSSFFSSQQFSTPPKYNLLLNGLRTKKDNLNRVLPCCAPNTVIQLKAENKLNNTNSKTPIVKI